MVDVRASLRLELRFSARIVTVVTIVTIDGARPGTCARFNLQWLMLLKAV